MIKNLKALYTTLGKVSPLGRESVKNLEMAFLFLEQLMYQEQKQQIDIKEGSDKNDGE